MGRAAGHNFNLSDDSPLVASVDPAEAFDRHFATAHAGLTSTLATLLRKEACGCIFEIGSQKAGDATRVPNNDD
jgi:hypothetical protein